MSGLLELGDLIVKKFEKCELLNTGGMKEMVRGCNNEEKRLAILLILLALLLTVCLFTFAHLICQLKWWQLTLIPLALSCSHVAIFCDC